MSLLDKLINGKFDPYAGDYYAKVNELFNEHGKKQPYPIYSIEDYNF